jgi:hypothetical protein
MYVALSVLEPPADEPVTVELAKQHLRVDHDDEDDLIAAYISVARELAENYLARCLVTQQLLWSISDAPPGPQWPLTAVTPVILPLWLPYPLVFQSPIRLPRSPVQSIDQVAVSHTGQLTDTVLTAGTNYTSDTTAAPARLLLNPSSMPQVGQHVLVTFTAGYATPAAIPRSVIHAILIGLSWLYEHRGDDDGGDMPNAFYALLTPYRLFYFG